MLAFITCVPLKSFRFHQNCAQKRARTKPLACASLVIGLNQYAHDASIAIIDASNGNLLFAQSKERITRRKHDGGDVSQLVIHALSTLCEPGASPEKVAHSVKLVVANNHHFPIAPFERRLPFQISLGYVPQSYASPWNLIGTNLPFVKPLSPHAEKHELSHHLAHAYAAAFHAPFDRGLVLIMDGMGDSLEHWDSAEKHHSEESIVANASYFREFPKNVRTGTKTSFREAETVYVFERIVGHIKFTRVYKRWTPENEPSELMNHSFEEMDSVGALYSRVSAVLFKDWNACGKVMGLAPYAGQRGDHKLKDDSRSFMKGNLFDGTLNVVEGKLNGMEHLNSSMNDCNGDDIENKKLRFYFEDLASGIQSDLEDVVTTFIYDLMKQTGEENIIFAGGVALNSTVNGIMSTAKGVKRLHIPPFPGDEGIAIGCAAFGYSFLARGKPFATGNVKLPFMPYLGKHYSDDHVAQAIDCFSPWITCTKCVSEKEAALALSKTEVVAWFNGRSEFGPRALGNRSILADPRSEVMLDHVNKVVKKRESFRPFAPSVLSGHVEEWFEKSDSLSSPFMSLTKKATKPDLVPAVVHVDGTSRLQTLQRDQNPTYYDLISQFFQLTGVPMVLNTSFNTAGEAIVESPYDALKCFLNADGIDVLVFPGLAVRKAKLGALSDDDIFESACATFRSEVARDCYGSSLRTTVKYSLNCMIEDTSSEEAFAEESVVLSDDIELAILEMFQQHDSCPVWKIVEEFLSNDFPEGSNIDDEEDVSKEDIYTRIMDLCAKRLIQKV